MGRKSRASGQQPKSGVVPSPEAVFGNGRVFDSGTLNPPHGRSSGSSVDPISISDSEDEDELVVSQLIPSSPEPPQAHASFKPVAQLSPLTHLKPLSIVQSRTSTPQIIPVDGADSRRPNATHISTVVFPRPMRPKVTAPGSTPDGSSCGMELSEDLTAQDIDIRLDTVPVPFVSLSRYHLASRRNGENEGQIEETSPWWYHPTFEARAKADILRTLSALLPSDPSQDPSPVDMVGWSEVRPRPSGEQIWERLEDSGSLDRGLDLLPKSSGGTPFSIDGVLPRHL
jgi:hypothetical protein